MPPALIAATPVGAVTTIRLGLSSLIWCRNVVLPVPALPVRKIFFRVLRTYSNARLRWELETKLICRSFPQPGPPGKILGHGSNDTGTHWSLVRQIGRASCRERVQV